MGNSTSNLCAQCKRLGQYAACRPVIRLLLKILAQTHQKLTHRSLEIVVQL